MIYKQTIVIIISALASHLVGYTQSKDSIVICEQTREDCATIYFRFSKSRIDIGYKHNAYDLNQIDLMVNDNIRNPKYSIDSIVFAISNSPDGDSGYNTQLGKSRAESLKRYILEKYPELAREKLVIYIIDENWDELRKMIADDPKVPQQTEALGILDYTHDHALRLELLTTLDAGNTFKYITQNMLRYLRRGTICINSRYLVSDTIEVSHELPIATDTLKQEPSIWDIQEGEEPILRIEEPKHPVLALKNNLLYDAALLPNIELEFYLGRRWSVNLEYQLAWWRFRSSDRFYQIMAIGPEIRYWFRPDTQFNGHFVGAYFGAGYYDLKYSEIGYQGEFYIAAGVSYGYYLPVKRGFGIEFSIGVGYMVTEYRKYTKEPTLDDYYIKAGVDNSKYFGPTKAKISLVWRLGDKNKR